MYLPPYFRNGKKVSWSHLWVLHLCINHCVVWSLILKPPSYTKKCILCDKWDCQYKGNYNWKPEGLRKWLYSVGVLSASVHVWQVILFPSCFFSFNIFKQSAESDASVTTNCQKNKMQSAANYIWWYRSDRTHPPKTREAVQSLTFSEPAGSFCNSAPLNGTLMGPTLFIGPGSGGVSAWRTKRGWFWWAIRRKEKRKWTVANKKSSKE